MSASKTSATADMANVSTFCLDDDVDEDDDPFGPPPSFDSSMHISLYKDLALQLSFNAIN